MGTWLCYGPHKLQRQEMPTRTLACTSVKVLSPSLSQGPHPTSAADRDLVAGGITLRVGCDILGTKSVWVDLLLHGWRISLGCFC
jgi:hypothetical protein